MNTLNDITTCSQVRAALGVSDEELTDETILQPMYLTQLKEELRMISPTLLAAIAAASTGVSEVEVRLKEVASLFATLQVAYFLRGSIHNFAPRMISDGKASMQRFIDPVAQVIEALKGDLASARVRLLDAHAAYVGQTSAQRTIVTGFASSRPGYDPVVG